MVVGRQVAFRCGCCGQIFFVYADVEAGLLEFLFDIDFTFLYERQEIAAHPGDFGEGEAVLGEIDGLSGEVG